MKKSNFISLVSCSLLIGTMAVTAQTKTITGTVVSLEDNMPVIGASVVVKGTTVGTVTNLDGNFTLDVPDNAKTIEISYVGM